MIVSEIYPVLELLKWFTGALACVLAIAAQATLGETGADWSKVRRVALVTVEYSFRPNHLIFRRPGPIGFTSKTTAASYTS
jgi:hypothetical protein